MKHITYALFLSALAFLYAPAAAATPNHCEFIIVEIQQAVEDGYLTQAEGAAMIKRCTKELWG